MKQEPSVSFIEPMTALRLQKLPVGSWLYEMKFDGYRALAFKDSAERRFRERIGGWCG
jgi:bifunctional non-homologous end joining protein LigD